MMKKEDTKTEAEYRKLLIDGYVDLYNDIKYKRLFLLLEERAPRGIFYMLSWTPGQGEDFYRVLVNGEDIVDVELSRYNESIEPIIEIGKVKTYENRASNQDRILLKIAKELTKEKVKKKSRD